MSSVLVLTLLLVNTSSLEYSYSQVFAQAEVILYVDPSTIQVAVNCSFSINVTVADVNDLYGFGCCLGYNSAILKALTVTIYPPFGGPIVIDETEGYVYVTGMLPPDYPKVSGSFDLFSITLEAQSSGNTVLSLYDTVLIGSEIAPMPHTTIDGFVEVYSTRLLLETDKSIYKLGENVTITLTNISNETVVIGGYPAWQIFTYPREEPVYPEAFIYLAWSLGPGESNSSIWNQYDEFSKDHVIPGTYVVKDLQGWGLASYFKIVYVDVIVPDDYPTIQQAIDNASPRDTIFVRNGTYYENITIDEPLSLIAESRDAIITQDHTHYTVEVRADNVTVRGFTIQNDPHPYNPPLPCGVLLNSASNCQIIDNELGPTLMPAGIIVDGGSENRIVRNEIAEGGSGYGIMVKGSVGNVIMQNTMDVQVNALELVCSDYNYVFCNYFAVHFHPYSRVWLFRSNSNIIEGNTLYDSSCDGISRMELLSSCNNSIFHNNFSGWSCSSVSIDEASRNNVWDQGYPSGGNYWIDYAGTDLDKDGIGDTPHVIDESNQDNYPLVNPWSPTVQNLNTGLYYTTIQGAINAPETLTGHTVFVSAGTYYENLVVNKTVSLIGQNREKTIIDGSGTGTAVTITVNNTNFGAFTIQNGKWEGIGLWNSGYNVIENVNVLNCTIGVMLANSYNNTIFASTIFDNQYGIMMNGKPTRYNEIENNILSNNGWGIDLTLSDRNVISKNTVTLNSKGIHLSDSHNNTIDGNTISNNKEEGVFLCYSNNNLICHNNFINNTNQVHLCNSLNNTWDNGCEGNYWSDYEERYPDATEIDHSGMWDTPYVIDENNGDNWPLMNPYWNPGDVDHDLDVDLYDAVRVLIAYGSTPPDSNWNPYCDIAEPYGVIDLYDAVLLLVNYGEKYS